MDYEPTKETIDAVIGAMVDSNWVHDRDEAEPEVRLFIKAAAPFIRAQVIEECAKVAEGVSCESAGDEYQTSGNGNFWDAGTMYDQGRSDAASNIRALIPAETKETM